LKKATIQAVELPGPQLRRTMPSVPTNSQPSAPQASKFSFRSPGRPVEVQRSALT
jgi:hypothetical protein